MNITLKDVPKPIYQRLKKTAALSGRSMNKCAIYTLDRGLPFAVRKDRAELLESIRKTRDSLNFTIDENFLCQAIHEGRE